MDNLAKPIHPEVEMVTSVDMITPGFSPPAVPHHGTSHLFQPTPTVTPVVSELAAPVYNNVPSLPLSQPTTIPSMSTTSKTISCGEDITEVGGERAYRVEDQDDIYYWSLAVWTTQESIFNAIGRDLVIDPNPQDMLFTNLLE